MSEDTEIDQPSAPASVKTGAKLWWPKAFAVSFFNLTVSFYPRLTRGSGISSMTSDEIIAQLVAAMSGWSKLKADDKDLDDAINLAKASLEEAKEQTEYQDQKATRLLTVTTFLSALSAGLYAAFNGFYPLATVWDFGPVRGWTVVAAHVSFLLFVLAVLAGMLITFHATRTRFKYSDTATATKESGPTRSYLFFREMIGVSPIGWAASFVGPCEKEADTFVLKENLKIEYLKNYISEAYLIAAKTADKLRFLEPAQSLLAWGLRSLLLFAVLLAVITANWVPAPTKPTVIRPAADAAPLKVEAVK